MMGSFLDALGIKHENGLIEDEEMAAPTPEKLREAAAAIAAQYPREDVALYLPRWSGRIPIRGVR